jgi:hypothetical protein
VKIVAPSERLAFRTKIGRWLRQKPLYEWRVTRAVKLSNRPARKRLPQQEREKENDEDENGALTSATPAVILVAPPIAGMEVLAQLIMHCPARCPYR